MTPNVTVRPQARDDIDDQAEYLNATMEIALRFLAAIDSTITLIARQPYMGVRSEYLRDPLMETRFQPVSGFQKHLVFYRPIELRTASKFSESFMALGTYTWCSEDDGGEAGTLLREMSRMIIRSLLLLGFLACLLLAADEKPAPKYEMTQYIMGLLRRAPHRTAVSAEETQRIQTGHMANINKMAATGKLIVAGPFSDDGEMRGVFIFQNASMEEVRAMVDQDPAVKAGRLVVELHPWFAAAGLRVNPPK